MEILDQTGIEKSPQIFTCNECGKVFKSKYSLRDHEVEKHGRSARYSCFVCDRGFYSRHMMISHVVVHDETRSSKTKGQELPKELLLELSKKSKVMFDGVEVSGGRQARPRSMVYLGFPTADIRKDSKGEHINMYLSV